MMWKDKTGKSVGREEFINRWKEGLRGVTPLQQTTIQIRSTWIMVIGLMAGIIISLVAVGDLWWLLLILTGGLGNTLVQLLGLWQKKKLLIEFEGGVTMEEGEEKTAKNTEGSETISYGS